MPSLPSSFHFDPTRPYGGSAVPGVYRRIACCEDDAASAEAESESESGSEPGADARGRARLHELNAHLHCSVVGTCLGTAELRKIVARLTALDAAATDVEVHHEGVTLAGDRQGGKVLTKALDKRHAASIQAFSKARDAEALAELWRQHLQAGTIPGAYWALMSHRHVTPELRQRAFGEVHMLSHLVGAANRADIRRLAALEAENAQWRERDERQQLRIADLVDERQRLEARLQRLEAAQAASAAREAQQAQSPAAAERSAELLGLRAEFQTQAKLVAFQALRREAAEQALAMAQAEEEQLRADLEGALQLNERMAGELRSIDAHLQALAASAGDMGGNGGASRQALAGKRFLYVGGRPSSTPAIRKLVTDAGGEFIHHDGGLEDRKGLLASALAGADLAAFPVDCIGHDAAGKLKRLSERHRVPCLVLRTASVTCLAAALAEIATPDSLPTDQVTPFRLCQRHG